MVRCAQPIAPDDTSPSAGSEKKVDALTPEVPQYLMSTVNEADAKRADSARMQFKDVVEANLGRCLHPCGLQKRDTDGTRKRISGVCATRAVSSW